uniref:Rho guanine nucleotide exchange factor (GEF) 11 n=1 Tax=Esox lucius TaxID=8010 RepID=A0A3P8XLD7_ESOLU
CTVNYPNETIDIPIFTLNVRDSERKTSSGQPREPPSDTPPESTGTGGLVQRCVVVQKDHLGFGFTVCGERIKLVQNVRPGGAAVKAGVHEGDRIIKVNGSLVSSMSHQEVVKLIKSGTYVALTLQGPPPSAAALPLQPLATDLLPNQRTSLGGEAPPPPPPPLPAGLTSTPTQRISKPLQVMNVQKHATQILRNMLEQEEAELQDLREEQSRNPSPSLVERIESAKRRAQQVRVKIQQDLDGTRSEAVTNYLIAGEGRLSVDSCEGDFEACESPHSSPSSLFRVPLHRRQGSDTHSSSDSAQIIGPEEEEEEDNNYTLNEMDGPFQDIELLKSRPAHMTVFMRYVFSQLLDPNPLLFYLSVEAYLGSSPKDARALAPQICSHFLDPDAWGVIIVISLSCLSESRLQAQEDIRGPLSELQQQVLPDIQDQIQDYRNKQMMGLASLFGEGDLQTLDGDPAKERQVVDRQVSALWEILSPLASAVLLYLRHTGIKLRDSRVFPGLSTEKEKWLAFFPKKKLSSVKKEKDGDDRKRNPILKYIGKPRGTSQSSKYTHTLLRPGSVRNIIQQFENHAEVPGEEGAEGDPQRLSSSSLGEDGMDSPLVSVRLARSESLKAQGEGRRRGGASGAETVPRSRSDVDMEDCGEEREGPGLSLLHHSTSSSASSSSARSLENPTPPYTPQSTRRSVDSPAALLPDAPALEEDVVDSHHWQETVTPDVLAALCPREVDRQAVIYELLTTEASHLRTLRVLDQVFFQKMRGVLNPYELACIFPNLPQVYDLHASLCEAMKNRRDTPIVQGIGDIMLARFEGEAGEEFQEQVSHLCSQQSQALELIKNKQRKDPRFSHIIQECEASPHCRRLQLKDLLVSEMQRLTKYPLLLDNILKHTEAGSPDLLPLQLAQTCCRGILQAVNEVVRETEHRQRLQQYQRRLDPTPQFKSLDLTSKTMIHEGPLTWKVSKDKTLEIQALLLSDLLVLLQRGPDDRLLLRCPSRWLGGGGGGSGDTKASFSPVVQLDSLLVRSVATDNKALYVISTTERQIYELVAGTSSEKNTRIGVAEAALEDGDTRLADHNLTLTYESENDMYTSDIIRVTTMSVSLLTLHLFISPHIFSVEMLRHLIFRDLEEDGWSRNSDGTPTNETADEGSPIDERRGPASSEAFLNSSRQWDAERVDGPPSVAGSPSVQVVRKAVVAGSPSVPDDITDDVTLRSDQSPEPRGNVFYLVMPVEPGEGLLGESHTDDVMSSPVRHHEEEGRAISLTSANNQSEWGNQGQEEGLGQSQKVPQSHVIKNVDEIFHTIEELMSKLHQLRNIETAHHQLLKTLGETPANRESGYLSRNQGAVDRTQSLDLTPRDGKFGGRGQGSRGSISHSFVWRSRLSERILRSLPLSVPHRS